MNHKLMLGVLLILIAYNGCTTAIEAIGMLGFSAKQILLLICSTIAGVGGLNILKQKENG